MMRSDSPTFSPTSSRGGGGGGRRDSLSSALLLSDRERDQRARQEQQDVVARLLDGLGDILDRADDVVTNLESDGDLLPSAIMRKCTEMADAMSSLASRLENQSPQERTDLAKAIHEDVVQLQLQQQEQIVQFHREQGLELEDGLASSPSSLSTEPFFSPSVEGTSRPTQSPLNDWNHSTTSVTSRNGTIIENDIQPGEILQALSGVSSLLRDVEAAFRDVGRSEADELADVGLTLARLVLMSLQSVYATLTPESLIEAAQDIPTTTGPSMLTTMDRSSAVTIEELPSEDPETKDRIVDLSLEPLAIHIEPGGDTFDRPQPHTKRRHLASRRVPKMRVLWPRLGPHVSSAMDWTKEEAGKRPVLSVALGLTLWPWAIGTAVVGGSMVVVDGVVQDAYNHWQNGPILSNLEQGAAQVYQTARLSLVTIKLVGRQSLRVASRQIERQGGVGPILENVGGMAVHRIVHPMETAGMVWDGLTWGIGALGDSVEQVLSKRQEANATAQELHQ